MDSHVVWCQVAMQLQSLIDTNGLVTSFQSISLIESVLSWLAGWWFWSVRWWSHAFDGGSEMFVKISWFYARKIRFLENHRGRNSRNSKKVDKMALFAEIWQPGFSWLQATMHLWSLATMGRVASGDHEPRSPATMGISSLLVIIFGPFLGLFQLFLLLYFFEFFPHLLAWFLWRKIDENPCKSKHKLSCFPKSEGFIADLPPEAETKSNDVGIT